MVRFWIPRLPPVLILVLKRFEFRDVSSLVGRAGVAHREKIDSFVDCPIRGLDLKSFSAGLNGDGDDARDSEGVSDESTLYDLFAVCNHFGKLGSGHYSAHCRDWTNSSSSDSNGDSSGECLSDQWFSFDDNDVVRIEEKNVVTKAAYILFYRKRTF